MIEFENINYLWGLLFIIPVTLLFITVLFWKKKVAHTLGDSRLINQLTIQYSHKKYKLKIILTIISITLGIVAATNMRKPLQSGNSKAMGIDVMIALDVSKSMLSEDEKPSRLEKAKQFITSLTDKIDNNRIGFVVFAGQAYLQMPLTADAVATKLYVSNASPEMVSLQGTNIGAALQLCTNSLNNKEKKYKAIILITDGEDQDNQALEAIKQLKEQGIILHTVGVGSPEGSPISEPGTNDYKKDGNGKTIISKLNESLLKSLAKDGNGSYHLLNNSVSVADDLSATLNDMEKKTISNAGGYKNYTSYYMYFLAAAIILLIAESFITETRKPIQV